MTNYFLLSLSLSVYFALVDTIFWSCCHNQQPTPSVFSLSIIFGKNGIRERAKTKMKHLRWRGGNFTLPPMSVPAQPSLQTTIVQPPSTAINIKQKFPHRSGSQIVILVPSMAWLENSQNHGESWHQKPKSSHDNNNDNNFFFVFFFLVYSCCLIDDNLHMWLGKLSFVDSWGWPSWPN